jgi:hypothetical protein
MEREGETTVEGLGGTASSGSTTSVQTSPRCGPRTATGAELVGEVAQYEDIYRLASHARP